MEENVKKYTEQMETTLQAMREWNSVGRDRIKKEMRDLRLSGEKERYKEKQQELNDLETKNNERVKLYKSLEAKAAAAKKDYQEHVRQKYGIAKEGR